MVNNQLHSIKHFGLARLLLLLLLAQHAVTGVAMSAGDMPAATAEMSGMADVAAHDCGGMDMVGMNHTNSEQMEHDHQKCVDSGCADCVGSVAAAVSSNLFIATSPHSAVNWQWPARMQVTAESETLYRPPIQS